MLEQTVQYIKGIGPKRAKILLKLGIAAVRDILNYLPREYDDRRQITKIAAAMPNQRVTILSKVEVANVISLSPGLSVFKAAVTDRTGVAYCVFFRKVNPYHKHDIFTKLKKDFSRGNYILANGFVEINFGEKQVRVEEYEPLPDPKNTGNLIHFNKIVPVYPLTEGLGQKWLREFVKDCIDKYISNWPEILPESLCKQKGLISAAEAISQIHFPESFAKAEIARKRLAFDEFLLLETALALVRKKKKQHPKPRSYTIKRSLLTPFRQKLGFDFTRSQKKAINEIFSDMKDNKPMNRILIGDVGSGKTVVAVSSVLLAIENSFQAAILAPTEILAEQHYITIQNMLEGLGVRVGLLTGKLNSKSKDKHALKSDIADGRINLIIGTHALLEEDVKFNNLGLIIIDEQHRFGVMQRARLHKKAELPDVLVMTATPIPRTLALTLYGDFDVSTINELPPGRQPIKTLYISEDKAYDSVKQEVKKGHQAYIVYPLVEESDKVELKSAVDEANNLSNTVFSDFKVGLLHGQMPAKLKEKIMIQFRNKEFDILIATTVIEVGIDIPNATMMVIQHSDRFGLATLHQLRGRVGRGQDKSFCVLLGIPKTEEAKRRIHIMISSCDGFRIAEEDLAIRGPGEFFGTAQHGMPPFKAGSIVSDIKLIEEARIAAEDILSKDPKIISREYASLRNELLRIYKGRFGLSTV